MKRKGTMLICALALGFSLTACGSKENGKDQTQTQESSAGSESIAGQESTTAPESTESSEDYAVWEDPADTGAQGGTENDAWSGDMEAVKTVLVDTLGENYWPNSKITADMLEGTFGVTSDMYDDYFGEMPMISTNVDTILVVRSKADQTDKVAEALNKYREALVNDTMQYPMNLGKIQASRIETIGNYVCFVQLGADVTAAMDKGDEEVIAHCQEQNELAIEVLSRQLAK